MLSLKIGSVYGSAHIIFCFLTSHRLFFTKQDWGDDGGSNRECSSGILCHYAWISVAHEENATTTACNELDAC